MVGAEIEALAKDRDDERTILENSFTSLIKQQIVNKIPSKSLKTIKSNKKISEDDLENFNIRELKKIAIRLGASDNELDEVDDSNNVRDTLISMILRKESD